MLHDSHSETDRTLGDALMNTIRRALFRTWAPALVLSFSTALADGTPMTVAYQTDSGANYITGGVRRDQRDASQAHRAFVPQVSVRIFDDAEQEVLKAEDAVPWLFTNLPSGKCRVEATLRGKAVVNTINVVADRQAQVAFFW
jgi:hypothetical protein